MVVLGGGERSGGGLVGSKAKGTMALNPKPATKARGRVGGVALALVISI